MTEPLVKENYASTYFLFKFHYTITSANIPHNGSDGRH